MGKQPLKANPSGPSEGGASLLCEACGIRPATRIFTRIVDGEKKVLYRCETCAESQQQGGRPKLERPCDRCGVREGRIKLVQLGEGFRTIRYVCEACAARR